MSAHRWMCWLIDQYEHMHTYTRYCLKKTTVHLCKLCTSITKQKQCKNHDFNKRFLIANTHTYNAHAILRNTGISWLHTRWTPKPPSIHTLTHGESFWQGRHHHGNKTQKREALAQMVYSNHRAGKRRELFSWRAEAWGEHGEWGSEGGGTQEQNFMLNVSRKHETENSSFMHFLCVNWIWPSRRNLKSTGSTTSKPVWEKGEYKNKKTNVQHCGDSCKYNRVCFSSNS